jgi:hypothetical protein
VLTPRVLVAALGKMATHEIEMAVEGLIEVLDRRQCDPDFEVDPDFEPDSDEESEQAARPADTFKFAVSPLNQIEQAVAA